MRDATANLGRSISNGFGVCGVLGAVRFGGFDLRRQEGEAMTNQAAERLRRYWEDTNDPMDDYGIDERTADYRTLAKAWLQEHSEFRWKAVGGE